MMKRSLSAFALICGFIAFSAESAKPLIHFPLNEGDSTAIRDAAGNAGKITFFNPEQLQWVDGPNGKALGFNTPDALRTYAGVAFVMPESFDPAKGFTVAATVRTSSPLHRSRQYELFNFSDRHESGPGIRITISWKMLYLMTSAAAEDKMKTATSSTAKLVIAPDTWYALAATYDGKVGRVYINGKLMGETADMSVGRPKNKKIAVIGASTSGGSGYGFQGVITNFRLFDSALDVSQIAALGEEQ